MHRRSLRLARHQTSLYSRASTTAGDGLPYKPRTISKDEIESLRDRHVWHTPPSLETAEMVFITADVMDDFISYGVFAWDVDDSLFLLDCGEVPYIELTEEKRKTLDEQRKADGKPPVSALEDILEKEYLCKDGVGIKPTFLVIDQGGHRAEEVKHFAKMHVNVIMQKGTSMTSATWRVSETQIRLVLTNEKHWRSTTIFYLYSQKNVNEGFLWLYPEISEEHLAEIRDVHPDSSSKWGNEPANWVSKTGKDHLFDVLKYAYFAKDFALQTFMKKRYRFAKAPSILRRFEKQRKREEQEQRSSTIDAGISAEMNK